MQPVQHSQLSRRHRRVPQSELDVPLALTDSTAASQLCQGTYLWNQSHWQGDNCFFFSSSHSAADFQANGLQEEKGKEGTPLSE